jgi:hypothetical protein
MKRRDPLSSDWSPTNFDFAGQTKMGDSASTLDGISGGGKVGSGSGGVASGLSLASLGLTAASDIEKGQGIAAGDTYKAATLDRAAQYGELKATQTNAQLTRNLAITLGNLDSVRAASRTDPTSPTGVAVRDYVEQTATEKKNIQVDSITAQAQEDEANAAYLRQASKSALLGGELGAAGDILKGIGPALPALLA